MGNLYHEMKDRHAAELRKFRRKNMFLAFSDDQYSAGLRKLGIAPDEPEAVRKVAPGSYVKADKAEALADMLQRMDAEVDAAARSDPQFALDMFTSVLSDLEGDSTAALSMLGYDVSDILKDDTLLTAFKQATGIE